MKNRKMHEIVVMMLMGAGSVFSPAAGAEPSPADLAKIVAQQAAQIEQLQREMAELKKAGAPEASYEERIKELVLSEVNRETAAQSRDLDTIKKAVGRINVHGFVSQGYLKSSHNNLVKQTEDGTYEFNEIGLNFSSQLTDKLRVGVQFLSRDYGEVGNNDIDIDWAYGDYRWQDWLGIRAGRIRAPLGFYNETRDVDMLRTSILMPQGIYIEDFRDAFAAVNGIGLYGEIPLGWLGGLSYQTLYGYPGVNEDSGLSQALTAVDITDINRVDNHYVYDAALIWTTPLDGLRVGGTMTLSRFDFFGNYAQSIPLGPGMPTIPAGNAMRFAIEDSIVTVVSAEYTLGDLILSSEYMHIRNLFVGRLLNAPYIGTRDVAETIWKADGFYAGPSYRFTDWLEAGMYYGYYRNPNGSPQNDYALSLKFDLADFWVFKLEGHYLNGTDYLHDYNNTQGMENNWFLFAAKTTFSF